MRTRILLLAVVVVALAAPPSAHAVPLLGLTINNGLFQFDSGSPGSIGPVMPITGLQPNETIHGIDFRPANGQLYGIGSMSRLYTIDPGTGAATEVAPLSMPLSGGSFGVDFNPVLDRLRVISDTDQNILVDPVTGTVTLGPAPAFMGGSPNPYITGTAYSNNMAGATSSTLYGINYGNNNDILATINELDGVITPVGPLGVSPPPLLGFDIAPDGSAFFATGSFFHFVSLATGNAPSGGTFPSQVFVKGLAAVLPAGTSGGTPGETPGGTQGGGLPGDFDLDGTVDAADYVLWRKGLVSEDGITVRMQTPEGVLEGDATELYNVWRSNFGRSSGSRRAGTAQRGRRKPVLFARNRTVLRGDDSKRVRVKLTKAGKRLVRGYKRRRLKVTLTLTVTYRPASGAAPQKRTFKQAVTLRVKRKRR